MSDVDLPKIGAPATRALVSIGITRLEQVADRSEADLPKIGPLALRILTEALADRGQSLRPSPPYLRPTSAVALTGSFRTLPPTAPFTPA